MGIYIRWNNVLFQEKLAFHSVLGLLPLSERRRNLPTYQQVYPNKQSLKSERSNSTFSEATKSI